MSNTEWYLRRQCRGEVLRTHRFLWWSWETCRYEYNPGLFGSYFIGPYPSREAAKRWPMYKPAHDQLVNADEMHPDLVACIKDGQAHGGHRETYFGPGEIANPTELLAKLRAIWEPSEASRLM